MHCDACRLASKIGTSPGTHRNAKTSGAAFNHTLVQRGCRFTDWKSLKYIEMVVLWFFSSLQQDVRRTCIHSVDFSLACFYTKAHISGMIAAMVTQDLEVVLRQSLSTLSPGNWTLKVSAFTLDIPGLQHVVLLMYKCIFHYLLILDFKHFCKDV